MTYESGSILHLPVDTDFIVLCVHHGLKEAELWKLRITLSVQQTSGAVEVDH